MIMFACGVAVGAVFAPFWMSCYEKVKAFVASK